MDISQRRGGYPIPPQAPKTLGVEFSGVVEALDEQQQQQADASDDFFHVGDEVFGLAYGGAYAEYVVVDVGMLMRKPRELSFVQCAAIAEAWMTATKALHLILEFVPGKSILWHAGGSGVSIAGIQLSRAAGASQIFATAGSDAKCQFITSGAVGATSAINYKSQDFVGEIMRQTDGKGVDYIVDYIGGPYFQKNLAAAATDCRIILLGRMGGMKVPEADISSILSKRIRIEGSTLRSRDLAYQVKLRKRLEAELPKFGSVFHIAIDTVLSWADIQEAHQRIEEAANCGKIVCTVD